MHHNAQSLLINGKYHLFGGVFNKTHSIWDIQSHKSSIIHIFNEWSYGKTSFGLVHVKSMDCLFLFGGLEYVRLSTSTTNFEIYHI